MVCDPARKVLALDLSNRTARMARMARNSDLSRKTIPHASNTRDIFFGWWNLVGLTSAGICAAAGSPLCMVTHIIPSTTYGWVGEENKTMGGCLPGHLSQNGTHGKQSTHQPLSMLNCSAGNSGAPFPFPTIPHASNTRDIFFGWWNLVGLTSAGICAAAGSPLCMVTHIIPSSATARSPCTFCRLVLLPPTPGTCSPTCGSASRTSSSRPEVECRRSCSSCGARSCCRAT